MTVVNCPFCQQALTLAPDMLQRPIRCQKCGQEFTATEPPRAAPASSPGAPPPGWASAPEYGDEVYAPGFDLARIDGQTRASWGAYRASEFNVAGAVILNIVTCNLFGLIYYGIQHGELPKISRADFGAGKAIGFTFIPYFNFYWIFRFWPGLVDRITLQLRLRNMSHLAPARGLAISACVLQLCSIIPYVGIVSAVAALVCYAILASQLQTAINAMAAAGGTGHVGAPS